MPGIVRLVEKSSDNIKVPISFKTEPRVNGVLRPFSASFEKPGQLSSTKRKAISGPPGLAGGVLFAVLLEVMV